MIRGVLTKTKASRLPALERLHESLHQPIFIIFFSEPSPIPFTPINPRWAHNFPLLGPESGLSIATAFKRVHPRSDARDQTLNTVIDLGYSFSFRHISFPTLGLALSLSLSFSVLCSLLFRRLSGEISSQVNPNSIFFAHTHTYAHSNFIRARSRWRISLPYIGFFFM